MASAATKTHLLLYEYMENGSVGERLYGNEQRWFLDWNARHKIAIGPAEGLCYLHFDCKPQIIHLDIKSNNFLLDQILQARIGDFGLAKLIEFPLPILKIHARCCRLVRLHCPRVRIPDESDRNVTYSFGVVLLESVTGQSPVQPLEQGGGLVTWVRRAIHNGVETAEIFDKRIDLTVKRTVEEMTLFLKIALFFTSTSPVDRPTMREVIAMMIDARESLSNCSSSPTSKSPLDEGASKEVRKKVKLLLLCGSCTALGIEF